MDASVRSRWVGRARWARLQGAHPGLREEHVRWPRGAAHHRSGSQPARPLRQLMTHMLGNPCSHD